MADDEVHVRRIARAVLEEEGYTLLEATNGLEAVQLFRERRDDLQLVVLDLLMPGLSGEEVFATLTEERPNLPVILTSGYPKEIATRQLDAAATLAGFIKKPFRLNELVDLVSSVLDPEDTP